MAAGCGIVIWLMRGCGLRVREALAIAREDSRDGGTRPPAPRTATCSPAPQGRRRQFSAKNTRSVASVLPRTSCESADARILLTLVIINGNGLPSNAIRASSSADTVTSRDAIAPVRLVSAGSRKSPDRWLSASQTWPANAQADIHTLALDTEKVGTDIRGGGLISAGTDSITVGAQTAAVRVGLGRPAADKYHSWIG